MDLFPSFMVQNVVGDSSDHLHIIVRACKEVRGMDRGVPWDEKPFKFKAKWLHVEDFKDVMSKALDVAGIHSGRSWTEKVLHCGHILRRWGNHTFKNIHKCLRWLLKRLR